MEKSNLIPEDVDIDGYAVYLYANLPPFRWRFFYCISTTWLLRRRVA